MLQKEDLRLDYPLLTRIINRAIARGYFCGVQGNISKPLLESWLYNSRFLEDYFLQCFYGKEDITKEKLNLSTIDQNNVICILSKEL